MTRQRAEERLAEIEADLIEAMNEAGKPWADAWAQTLRAHRHWLRRKLEKMPVAVAGRIGDDGPRAA